MPDFSPTEYAVPGFVALVLIGWFVTGVLVFLIGFVVPRLVKR